MFSQTLARPEEAWTALALLVPFQYSNYEMIPVFTHRWLDNRIITHYFNGNLIFLAKAPGGELLTGMGCRPNTGEVNGGHLSHVLSHPPLRRPPHTLILPSGNAKWAYTPEIMRLYPTDIPIYNTDDDVLPMHATDVGTTHR